MPDTMRNRLKLLLERQKTVDSIERILDDDQHRHFAKVLDTTLDRVEGKVMQGIDLSTGGQPIPGVVILPPTEAQALPQPTPAPQLNATNVEGGGGTPDQVGG